MKEIAVIGAGYVGLVTGVCFATRGFKVTLVERDEKRFENLKAGIVPFYEPKLAPLLKDALESGMLMCVQSVEELCEKQPEIIFSCVGTPSRPDGGVDLTDVWRVVTAIGKRLTHNTVFVHKSTVPVGVTRRTATVIKDILKQRGLDIAVHVASNPEFLREGRAVDDFLYPDRVVIGVESQSVAHEFRALYKSFVKHDEQILTMNFESAEMAKYASNTMLATRISFINELALLADKVGADIHEVKVAMGKDPRIGPSFLEAGVGYGGSCFPKDVKALVNLGRMHDVPMTIAKAAEEANMVQRVKFVERIKEHFGSELKSKKCGVWGLAFKPETDDLRDAPALTILEQLAPMCRELIVFDPIAMENFAQYYPDKNYTFARSAKDVLEKADFLIVLTDWREFKDHAVKDFSLLSDKTIFDGRNCLDFHALLLEGVTYVTMGRCSQSRQQLCAMPDLDENICLVHKD